MLTSLDTILMTMEKGKSEIIEKGLLANSMSYKWTDVLLYCYYVFAYFLVYLISQNLLLFSCLLVQKECKMYIFIYVLIIKLSCLGLLHFYNLRLSISVLAVSAFAEDSLQISFLSFKTNGLVIPRRAPRLHMEVYKGFHWQLLAKLNILSYLVKF